LRTLNIFICSFIITYIFLKYLYITFFKAAIIENFKFIYSFIYYYIYIFKKLKINKKKYYLSKIDLFDLIFYYYLLNFFFNCMYFYFLFISNTIKIKKILKMIILFYNIKKFLII